MKLREDEKDKKCGHENVHFNVTRKLRIKFNLSIRPSPHHFHRDRILQLIKSIYRGRGKYLIITIVRVEFNSLELRVSIFPLVALVSTELSSLRLGS